VQGRDWDKGGVRMSKRIKSIGYVNSILEGYSSNLVLHFQKVGGLVKVKIVALTVALGYGWTDCVPNMKYEIIN